MKKLGMVLGAAAVAVVAGCKDPGYRRDGVSTQNEVKNAEPIAVETMPAQVQVEAPKCTCAPGTKHAEPCKCNAPDCACIIVPKAVAPAPAPVEPEFTVYIVQSGDFLSKISKKFNVTINSIKRLNKMTSDLVRVGQKLKLPGKVEVGEQKAPVVAKAPAAKAPAKAATAYTGATKEYVVKNGDTLGAIAYSNGITIRQLKSLNGITSNALKIGQKLKVPAEKVVAAEKKAEKKEAPVEKKAEAPKAEVKEPAAPAAEAAPAPATAPAEAAPAAAAAPAPAEAAPAETQAAAPATFAYTVKEGEDITAIVVKFGVGAAEIRELNNLGENDTLKAGQTIKLPAEAQQ